MLAERARATYARALAGQFGPGESVTLRRASGASAGDYSVSAWVTQVQPSDVVGQVQQLHRKAIILASDVEDSGFPTPFLSRQDRMVWQGKTLVMSAIDDGTRRVQGILLAYEITLAGS